MLRLKPCSQIADYYSTALHFTTTTVQGKRNGEKESSMDAQGFVTFLSEPNALICEGVLTRKGSALVGDYKLTLLEHTLTRQQQPQPQSPPDVTQAQRISLITTAYIIITSFGEIKIHLKIDFRNMFQVSKSGLLLTLLMLRLHSSKAQER